MKLLLVNPYIYDFTAYDLWLRPLGLLYLAAVVRRYTDCEIFWIDALDRFQEGGMPQAGWGGREDGRGKFLRKIVEKPEVYREVPRHYARYGIPVENFQKKLNELPAVDHIFLTSLMTYWHDGVRFTIDRLKERFPDVPISLGGILPTLMPRFAARSLAVDHIFQGAGEALILDFLEAQGAGVRPHPDFSQLGDIPVPAFDLLSSQRFLPLLTSRGCPLRCTYCASSLLNERFRQRPSPDVVSEIRQTVEVFGTEHFILFDDALLINKTERFTGIFSQVAGRFDVGFHTPNGLHAREIDRNTADLLFASGFKTIRLGFESTNPKILEKSDRKLNVRQMAEAVDHLKRAGFAASDIEVYLLFGVPGQGMKGIRESLAHVRDLGVVPRLAVYSPVPGTPDFLELQRRDILSAEPDPYETNKIYFLYRKTGFSEGDITDIKDFTREIARSNRTEVDIHRHRC